MYGRRTTYDGQSFNVQDIASGHCPIEYTATPKEAFAPGAGYTRENRGEEPYETIVPPDYGGPAESWEEFFGV